MFCPKCGNEVKDGSSSCESCGTKIDAAQISQKKDSRENAKSVDADKKPGTDTQSDVADGTGSNEVQDQKSKSKMSGAMVGGIVAVVIVVLVLIIGFATNWFGLASPQPEEIVEDSVASQDSGEQQDPGATDEQESNADADAGETVVQHQVLQTEPPMFILKNKAYNFNGTLANVLDGIPDITGDLQEYEYLAPMGDNLTIVKYETAEYDEEWKSYGDSTTHYAIVGEKSASLDPILKKYKATEIKQLDAFRNGMTFIRLGDKSTDRVIAIDDEGKELTPRINTSSTDYRISGSYAVENTHRISYTANDKIDYKFYNAAGDLSYSGRNSGLVGENLVVRKNTDGPDYESIIYDVSGKSVIDLKSVANESAAKVCVVPLGVMNGVVEVDQYKSAKDEKPSLQGIYSIPLQKWLVEPVASTNHVFQVTEYGSDIISVYAWNGTTSKQFINTLTGEIVYTDDEDTEWLDLGNRWFVGINDTKNSTYYGLYHFDGDNPGEYDDGSFPLVNNDDFSSGELSGIYSNVDWAN